MHNVSNPDVFCNCDQCSGVLNGCLEGRPSAWEAHPIRIDQSGRATKRVPEVVRMTEIERKDLNLTAERVGPLHVVSQSADFVAATEQKLRCVLSREAKCPGDDSGVNGLFRRTS